MDLKEFIETAIVQIAEGVTSADTKMAEMGGLVNPGSYSKPVKDAQNRKIQDPLFQAPRTKLDFDIAVSASDTSSKGGDAKARIWVVEASVGGSKDTVRETVSRLSFSLEVILPTDPMLMARVGHIALTKRRSELDEADQAASK